MIFLAIRYLVERKRQTILTLLGVFFGTMAFVTVSGYFLGFQGFLVQQLVNNNAQVHIEARQDYLKDHDLDVAFFGEKIGHTFWKPPPAGVKGYLGVQSPQMWYKRLTADPRVAAYAGAQAAGRREQGVHHRPCGRHESRSSQCAVERLGRTTREQLLHFAVTESAESSHYGPISFTDVSLCPADTPRNAAFQPF